MLDLLHVKTFVFVAKTNFTRAAHQLGCSQSTVTLRVKMLERELGASLLERSKFGRTNALTVVGRQVYDYAVRILDLVDEVKTKVRELVPPKPEKDLAANPASDSKHPSQNFLNSRRLVGCSDAPKIKPDSDRSHKESSN